MNSVYQYIGIHSETVCTHAQAEFGVYSLSSDAIWARYNAMATPLK
jgi:hypothetical protein